MMAILPPVRADIVLTKFSAAHPLKIMPLGDSIITSGNHVILSWPTNSSGYTLYQTTNLQAA